MLARIGRAVMAPLWTAQLFTGTKSFERNRLIGSRWLNERGLHVARMSSAHRIADARRRRLVTLVSAADREDFARDGFVIRRDFLPAAQFAALLAQVHAYRGGLREIAEGDTIMRKIALASEALAALPALATLLDSPEWRGLIRYIGSRDAEPVVWIQSILRHALDGPPDPQTALHADTFHPTVKAWLFLTDVAADAGPFTYVPGSHRLTEKRPGAAFSAGSSAICSSGPASSRIAGAPGLASRPLTGLRSGLTRCWRDRHNGVGSRPIPQIRRAAAAAGARSAAADRLRGAGERLRSRRRRWQRDPADRRALARGAHRRGRFLGRDAGQGGGRKSWHRVATGRSCDLAAAG